MHVVGGAFFFESALDASLSTGSHHAWSCHSAVNLEQCCTIATVHLSQGAEELA